MIIDNNVVTCEYKKIYDLNQKDIYIPIFQRFYAWKSQQIVQFKNDIIECVNNPKYKLYLLDFICYDEDGKLKIADGQQRLVTLNNLIKAIKDVACEKQVKIKNIDLFNISYDISANDKRYQTHFYSYAVSPFKTVYLELKTFVEENVNYINDIIEIIKERIFIYLKKCKNADDAFTIFQQINTGGKPLTKDEVIKTSLDQYSQIYNIELDTSKIKEIRQSLISYYKIKKNDMNKNFDNMEIITFLRDYVTKDKNTYKDFCDAISLFANQQNNPIYYVINYINRVTLYDVLNILAVKKIDINKNKMYQIGLMIPLCMMSIILTLNGGSPTIYKYLLNEIIDMLKRDIKLENIRNFLIDIINKEPLTWKIKLDDFVIKLGAVETAKGIKKALLILDIIDKNVSGNINVDLINLEHIYPQNPNYEWALNGWPSHRETQKELIDNIGNYLLLNETINKSIQNQYITQKVIKYKEIIQRDRILQTPINTFDFEEFENERSSYIYKRQCYIAKEIQNNIPFGKILILN